MTRESVVVVAPGRGTYSAGELGYLASHHGKNHSLVKTVDEYRRSAGWVPVSELDAAERFRPSVHTLGGNASALIYTAALADFGAIDQSRYEIVAVTGNSMGWYLALAAAGVTDPFGSGIHLVEQMAQLMDEQGIGGQLLYPLMDDDWRWLPERVRLVEQLIDETQELFLSIRLGGSLVLAGSDEGLREAESRLPVVADQYPARLIRHAAFHTPLLQHVSERAVELLSPHDFVSPTLTLIDGLGDIWSPGSDAAALYDYTLGTQVVAPYNFRRAIEVAVQEFAPDRVIVLGPGKAMGAPVLQTLAALDWLGLDTREAWFERQSRDPFVLAMGIEEQRERVIAL